jgi:POLQ-like helicase
MNNNSKQNSQSWPYIRHKVFEEKLHKSNANWFAERACDVNNRMPYLLERWEDWPKNIILPEVANFIQTEQKLRNDLGERFPLHRYIHHGLSSQAMLFNLIGPLVVQGNLAPFKLALEAVGISWPPEVVTPIFEVENRKIFNEDTGQPTSIDFVIQGNDNTRSLFIEAKLVEREFGGCSVFQGGDCDGRNPYKNFNDCYLHYIGRRYWILLEKYGFLSGLTGISAICPLALYYQFFRELVFAIESGGDFVLLYDERNPSFYSDGLSGDRGLMPFLTQFVPEGIHSRIHSISIQQVIETFRCQEEFAWLPEFKKKYALLQKSG